MTDEGRPGRYIRVQYETLPPGPPTSLRIDSLDLKTVSQSELDRRREAAEIAALRRDLHMLHNKYGHLKGFGKLVREGMLGETVIDLDED